VEFALSCKILLDKGGIKVRITKKRLGDILLEHNLITPEQLQKALEEQKATGSRLGEVLVRLKFVSEIDIAKILSKQLEIPLVDLRDQYIDEEICNIIPAGFADNNKVLPLRTEGKELVVAVSDPLNVLILDDLRVITNYKIRPVIATESQISEFIQRYLRKRNYISDVMIEEAEDSGDNEVDIAVTLQEVNDAPVVRLVNSIIEQAVAERASDIHIEVMNKKGRVRFRIDGILREVVAPPLNLMPSVISRIKILAKLDISEKRLPQDGRIQLIVNKQEIDLRVSTLPTIFGEKVVIRVLNKSLNMFDLRELGFESEVVQSYERLLRSSYGMLLVTGPTGSGKTTTLYATLKELNDPKKNIITVEDPVEYQLSGINQVAINSRIGLTFANCLRSILRQDPNIIMVGEIRDGETAEIAVRSAMTGHLVLSTLHTNDAVSATLRLIDMGIEPYLVASSVRGVIAQRLVRRLCDQCKEKYKLAPAAPECQIFNLNPEEEHYFFRAKGCSYCGNTGYRGRVAIFELFVMGQEERELVLGKANTEKLRSVAISKGMKTLKEDGLAKALKGLTSLEEVIRVAYLE
jgi:type IV pilus assembly protein PilB